MGRIDIFKVDNKLDERERERGERGIGQKPSFFRSSAFFHLCSPRPDDDLFTKSFFFHGVYKIKNRIREFYFTFKKIKIFGVFGENSI